MTQSHLPQNPTENPQKLSDPTASYPYPPVSPEAVAILESQGCAARNWADVRLHPDSDLRLLHDVEFEGEVSIGLLDSSVYPGCGIKSVLLTDCRIGNGVRLRHIPGGIRSARIGHGAVIENCARISYDNQHVCGIGMHVAVLDETGSREVMVYPGLSAQSAMLMARCRRSQAEELYIQTQDYIDSLHLPQGIGGNTEILDCGEIYNVNVGARVKIHGARSLRNGSIFNNANDPSEGIAFVGAGVDADGFLIEDGVVEAGALLRHCYVGQGVRIEKGFTAHDSLFFANCIMENGEACAVFAGPYTVSVHKGTLLIGCQTSFMNAGSSTNQSNHMYKLGPVHWGVLERGVKTSSGSYLMLGANIGAFSLLMGSHKTHPDSKEFPFSYLFGDPQGATVVVPAVMLRSCGLLRDEMKWPQRDRRLNMPKRDRVIFDVLNPVTVNTMIEALETIRPMLSRHADDDRYHRYKGMKLSRASLDRAMKLYRLGVLKYLAKTLFHDGKVPQGWKFPTPPADSEVRDNDAAQWIDLAGQPIPQPILENAINAQGVLERENIFNEAFESYKELELRWIAARFPDSLRPDAEEILEGAAEFDRLVDLDRTTYRDSISSELSMLGLF